MVWYHALFLSTKRQSKDKNEKVSGSLTSTLCHHRLRLWCDNFSSLILWARGGLYGPSGAGSFPPSFGQNPKEQQLFSWNLPLWHQKVWWSVGRRGIFGPGSLSSRKRRWSTDGRSANFVKRYLSIFLYFVLFNGWSLGHIRYRSQICSIFPVR